MRRSVLVVVVVALGALLAAGPTLVGPPEVRAAGGAANLTLLYRSTLFSLTQASQHIAPVVTGGSGATTFSVTGTLPDGVTFDPQTGVFTGPSSWWGFESISVGNSHSCAVTTTGGVKCWGNNEHGRLGDGTTTGRSTPVDVVVAVGGPTLSGVTSVSAGGNHTCALMASGGVKCWGNNGDGQLGDGTTTPSTVPVDVSGLSSDVTALATGADHTCALLISGEVQCWGRKNDGRLGDGSGGTGANSSPVDVATGAGTPLSGVTAITTGPRHTCAVMSSGGAMCWGTGQRGRLGNNESVQQNSPVNVTSGAGTPLSGVTSISAGGEYTCALLSAGGVTCWGANGDGQLGDGTSGTNRFTPVTVTTGAGTPLSGATVITTGLRHTCSVTASGGVKCWGDNGNGRLGDGTTTSRWTPVDVLVSAGGSALSGVAAISAGDAHTCALTTTHWVKCWGNNGQGRIGDGTDSGNRLTPVDVAAWRVTVTVTVTDGTSSASQSFTLTTTPDPVTPLVPLAPVGLTVATTSATSLSVAWDPPLDDGGSPITDYEVTPACSATAATACVIGGLTADTTVNVSVLARNAVGASDLATASITLAGTAMAAAPTPTPTPAIPWWWSGLPVDRLDGPDRLDTAIAISQTFGAVSPRVVYLASGEVFADALVAGSSAARHGGTVLLVERTRIAPEVLVELQRLTPGEVVIVGGYAAVSLEVERAIAAAGMTVRRVAGTDRFATATELSREQHPRGALTVHIATGLGFADAMTAGVLAAVEDGPVLLVRPDGIPEATAAELARLRPQRMVIVGGTQAIGEEVARLLEGFAPQVSRLWGADRYATSVAVAQSRFQPGTPTVFLASGEQFAHGLGVVGPAGRLGGPVLLTTSSCVPPVVLAELDRLRPRRVVLLDGAALPATTVDGLLQAACR